MAVAASRDLPLVRAFECELHLERLNREGADANVGLAVSADDDVVLVAADHIDREDAGERGAAVAVVVATEDGGAGATGEQGDAGVEVRQAAGREGVAAGVGRGPAEDGVVVECVVAERTGVAESGEVEVAGGGGGVDRDGVAVDGDRAVADAADRDQGGPAVGIPCGATAERIDGADLRAAVGVDAGGGAGVLRRRLRAGRNRGQA